MPRSPLASPLFASSPYCASGNGRAFSKPDIRTTLERLAEDESASAPPLPILDLFSIKTFEAILDDPAAAARFRAFLGPDGHVDDFDFLIQVGEYNRAVSLLSQTVSNIALKHIGVTAHSPVRIPMEIGKSLNTDMREVSASVVPNLKCLFEDAGGYIEQNFARNIYPDFLKQQLSLNLQVINHGYSPNQTCPGFGDAFCLTDPNKFDDPMVFASDGFARLTGYSNRELISHNCRMLQGPRTRGSCLDRIRHGFNSKGNGNSNEFTELVLNYKKDGTVYWNLLFMARLFGLDGSIRYHLGGQIDVTEMLERVEDVTHFLGIAPAMLGEAPSSPGRQNHHQRPHNNHTEEPESRTQSRMGHSGDDKVKYPPSVSRNRILQSFKWRQSSSSSSQQQQQQHSRPPSSENNTTTSTGFSSISEPTTPVESRRPATTFSSTASSSNSCSHTAVSSPYSRFLVLEHIPSPSSSSSSSTTDSNFRSDHHKKKNARPQLPLNFCSTSCLEMFGNGEHELADVIGMDVFEVLSDMAGSNSITKGFKAAVHKSITEGTAVKLDLNMGSGPGSLNNGGGSSSGGFHRVKRSRGLSMTRRHHHSHHHHNNNHFTPEPLPAMSSSFNSNGNSKVSSELAGGSGSDGHALHRSISVERLVSRASNSVMSSGANYVSYWSPLKDETGAVRWIVVVLVPEVI